MAQWRSGQGLGKHLTTIHHVPERPPLYGELPPGLKPQIVSMLKSRGFDRLYHHQAEAVRGAMNGEHVVVVTPTASGKSMCYHLPVLDSLFWGGNALYLFPTKALSQDQTSELNTLLSLLPDRSPDWEAQVYDGDTPPDVRRRIRRSSRLLVTNPDMLHGAILPNHEQWATFFRRLQYVVIDELHTYRGVFGSHVANVIRRLKRLCAHYEASPTFICTSATIANPKELAQGLIGHEEVTLIDRNGSPAPARYICFLNPPIKDMQQMRRSSALSMAGRVARETLQRDLGTIVFARSRQSVEVLVHRLKERLEQDRGSGNLADRVASYRGGYLPDLRRSIERGLRDGFIKGVISTNALELGIDIGGLDVCIQAGYAGTIASTWQQLGRAGRRGGAALGVVIATDDPLDQFIINNPKYFLEQPPEHARIDPDNLRVAVEHLKCACHELAWRDGEGFGAFGPQATREMLEFLEAETGMVHLAEGRWRWSDRHYPASEVNLRNIAEQNFVVVDITQRPDRIIAEVDFESAHTTLYPQAVYQVSGKPYRVERLDYKERRAYVRRSEDGHYTTAMCYSRVSVLECFDEATTHGVDVGFGEVCVTQRFVGFKKIRFGTGENVGYGELELPELDLHTMSYWVNLPSKRFPELSREPERWARIVAAIGQVLKTVASLLLMCDPRDIDLCIGSVAQDSWLTQGFNGLTLRDTQGQAHLFMPQEDAAQAGPNVILPDLYNPTIFIYDRYPGGVGFGEGLFERHEGFMALGLELVLGCRCKEGCPSCVGPPEPGKGSVKEAVELLLTLLSRGAKPAKKILK